MHQTSDLWREQQHGVKIYCTEHALEVMVYFPQKQCVGDGCTKRESYDVSDRRRPEYCARHAHEGMVYVMKKMCTGDGCTKQPSNGVTGSAKRKYCAAHALKGKVDVVKT